MGARRRAVTAAGISAIGLPVAAWFVGSAGGPEAATETEGVPIQGMTTPSGEVPRPGPATYVGTRTCGSCHVDQEERYRGSHHDRSLQQPTRQTVLAPFDGEVVAHDGSSSSFAAPRQREPEGDRDVCSLPLTPRAASGRAATRRTPACLLSPCLAHGASPNGLAPRGGRTGGRSSPWPEQGTRPPWRG